MSASKQQLNPDGPGDCYPVAAELVVYAFAAEPSARLCHGMVTGNGGDALGIRHGHAWVETTLAHTPVVLVTDNSNGKEYLGLSKRYYEAGQIVEAEVRRYTRAETMRMLLKHQHYGPWPE